MSSDRSIRWRGAARSSPRCCFHTSLPPPTRTRTHTPHPEHSLQASAMSPPFVRLCVTGQRALLHRTLSCCGACMLTRTPPLFSARTSSTSLGLWTLQLCSVSEPVWPSGKASGWLAEGPRFNSASALLSLERGRGLWTVL